MIRLNTNHAVTIIIQIMSKKHIKILGRILYYIDGKKNDPFSA